MERVQQIVGHWFSRADGVAGHLVARWIFLRCLGLIYFSAFFALLFQVRGLVGTQGILPAGEYLKQLVALHGMRFWYAPTLLWISPNNAWIVGLCWVGLVASVLVAVNVAPRPMLLVCWVCFLSFVAAAQDFSGYQSDGMLLEAGFLALFVAPSGLWPGWGAKKLASRAAWFLLLWEWFRIYFESGVVKLRSGDPTWRNLTAMYEYYQNGPLPTWIGWYLQHLPHWFQRATAGATLFMELVLVWMAFLPRRWRIVCFFVVTAWQVVVIATANYAFLNYLVLVLAFLLLDDRFLLRFVPARWRPVEGDSVARVERRPLVAMGTAVTVVLMVWIFYATTAPLVGMFWSAAPLPETPVSVLDPWRIANTYGLFAVMTPHRYEIEFQGSNDGENWVAYPFRYKPQDLKARPGIYAPYQPRFDWNLWFASLGTWQDNAIVPRTEELLLEDDRDVLGLFAGDPFAGKPPKYVRAVLWQYWFSDPAEKRTQGVWWRRELLGAYAPTLTRESDGQFGMLP